MDIGAWMQTLANLPFEQNRATPETARTLMEELTFHQATQAYLWAMPLLNTLGMKFGSEKVFGAGYNVLPVWKERLDPKTLVTTPNSDASYKVTLPPNAPVSLFWSLTLYEAENGSGLATEARRFPSLGSRDKPAQNADRTTDLYIGPKAPAGKEGNWLPTAPGRGFFAILRLYGPEKAGIDFSWKPGDFEKTTF